MTTRKAPALDLASLAAGAITVKTLPKPTRKAGGTEALSALVWRSYTEGKIFELPPVTVPIGGTTARVSATLVSAVRRAAALAGLGVTVRSEAIQNGVVITFKGKSKGKKVTGE